MATRPFLLPAAVSGRHRPGRKTPCGAYVMSHALAARTGLVTDERNQEELADRVVAVTAVTGKYLDSQRLRFVSSDDGSRTWRGRSRRQLSAPGRTGCWWSRLPRAPPTPPPPRRRR